MRELADDTAERRSCWPQNIWTWRTWREFSTQWNVVSGLGGAAYICMRHEALPDAMEAAGVPEDQRRNVRRGIRVMEKAALEILNKAADK
jgi:hypothetical protein